MSQPFVANETCIIFVGVCAHSLEVLVAALRYGSQYPQIVGRSATCGPAITFAQHQSRIFTVGADEQLTLRMTQLAIDCSFLVQCCLASASNAIERRLTSAIQCRQATFSSGLRFNSSTVASTVETQALKYEMESKPAHTTTPTRNCSLNCNSTCYSWY